MEPVETYRWLMGGGPRPACDAFDAHVVACTLSLCLTECAVEGRSLPAAVGLEGGLLTAFAAPIFPHAEALFAELDSTETSPIEGDEAALRQLLVRCTTNGTPFQEQLALVVARRAQRPNHLWQDLGLRSRKELSWLMGRHFEWLSARNAQDMKWKKFLYRAICRDGSFPVCTAPSCSECSDFEACFGDESGESLMARARREAERP
jgi:nitrogen fixation protein NifQ